MLASLAGYCYGLHVTRETARTERRILPGAVRRMRLLQHKTQDEIATAAGINFSSLAHIERGRQPSLEVMCKVANGLGVDLDDITYTTAVYVVDGAVA